MTENESSSEKHVCGACGKSFESKKDLERHIHEVGLVD